MNPFKIGVVGGVNINKEYRVFDNSDKTIGFHIGGIYEYHFKNNTFLSGSTLFIKKGGEYDYSASYEDEVYYQKFKKENYYLEIPIHFGYRYSFNQNVSLSGSFGPYLGIGLFGKYKAIKGEFKNDDNKIYSDSNSNRFDMGLGGKLSLNIFKHYHIGVGYNYGLTKTNDDLSDKNRNIMISVGYMF